MPSWREVFLYFLFLGFVNVGGPVAQITMMFNHMVEKRRMALQRSLHQNHGFLPRASRPGGVAIGDLRWLPETETMGRRFGRCHLHFCRVQLPWSF
jgi:hypothetical protein